MAARRHGAVRVGSGNAATGHTRILVIAAVMMAMPYVAVEPILESRVSLTISVAR